MDSKSKTNKNCALKKVVDLAGLDQSVSYTKVIETLGATDQAVNGLTLNQLRSLMQNALDTIHQEITGKIDSEGLKH